MPPSELARRLKSLQIKSTELLVCLVALNRDSTVLIDRLEDFDMFDFTESDWEGIQEAVKTYAETLEAMRQHLEGFCDVAGHIFDGGTH